MLLSVHLDASGHIHHCILVASRAVRLLVLLFPPPLGPRAEGLWHEGLGKGRMEGTELRNKVIGLTGPHGGVHSFDGCAEVVAREVDMAQKMGNTIQSWHHQKLQGGLFAPLCSHKDTPGCMDISAQ